MFRTSLMPSFFFHKRKIQKHKLQMAIDFLFEFLDAIHGAIFLNVLRYGFGGANIRLFF